MKDTADFTAVPVQPPLPREYHGVNWTGFVTLYMKEVRRFWKVGMQTLAAPVLNALLYLLIFVVAMAGVRPSVNGVPFAVFIGPGLIMMSILNAAFANSASSLMQAKMMGLAQDFLTPPLSPTEQAAAFTLGAATRGIVVGLVTAAAVYAFTPFTIVHWWAVIYFALGASMVMGLIGVAAGLWAEKFDHMAAVTTFVVMPLSMLSGTFYTVDRLPEPFPHDLGVQPVLLHDRRLPLRVHGPSRRIGRRRGGRGRGADRGVELVLLVVVPDGIPAEKLSRPPTASPAC